MGMVWVSRDGCVGDMLRRTVILLFFFTKVSVQNEGWSAMQLGLNELLPNAYISATDRVTSAEERGWNFNRSKAGGAIWRQAVAMGTCRDGSNLQYMHTFALLKFVGWFALGVSCSVFDAGSVSVLFKSGFALDNRWDCNDLFANISA